MATPIDVPVFSTARASHPWLVRAMNRIGALLPLSSLDDEKIWTEAILKEPGCPEPSADAREALAVLVEDLRRHVDFTPLGTFSALDDTLRIARTHVRIERALAARPETLAIELSPPVFIIGWARTGTTFLHQLLAQDPANRTMPYWESFDPVPPPEGEADTRAPRLDKMLGQLRFLAPGYDAIHPMTADSPEECVALFMNAFRTHQFDFQYRVPGYANWLLEQDPNVAYTAYLRQLKLVTAARPAGARLLLKDPTHILHLETIEALFPNAKFIFTHRDPAEALSSVGSLIAYTRALFTDDVDASAIGRELLDGYWPPALEAARKFRAELPEGRAVDVRHPDLRADPIAMVQTIYQTLGLEFSDAARAAMTAFLDQRASSPGGRHQHALETIGLSREIVRDRFADYCAAMSV